MQRVRVGLTGLACVFLLVMLATALLRLADSGDATTNQASVVLNTAAPAEPLAQLGVAPGNTPPDTSAKAAAASPRPATPAPPAR